MTVYRSGDVVREEYLRYDEWTDITDWIREVEGNDTAIGIEVNALSRWNDAECPAVFQHRPYPYTLDQMIWEGRANNSGLDIDDAVSVSGSD